MRFRLLILVILMKLNCVIFAQEPIKPSSNSIKQDSSNLKQIEASSDTLKVELVNPTSDSQPSNWVTRWGVLIGTLGSGLVAVFSVWKTDKNASKRELIKVQEQKEIRNNQYCGLLAGILYILQSHGHKVKKIQSLLDSIKTGTLERQRLVVSDFGQRLSLDILSKCVLKLLAFEQYNAKIGSSAIYYLLSAEDLNSSFDFSQVARLEEIMKDDTTKYLNMVKMYCDALNNHVVLLENGRKIICLQIEEELEKCSQKINIIS